MIDEHNAILKIGSVVEVWHADQWHIGRVVGGYAFHVDVEVDGIGVLVFDAAEIINYVRLFKPSRTIYRKVKERIHGSSRGQQ